MNTLQALVPTTRHVEPVNNLPTLMAVAVAAKSLDTAREQGTAMVQKLLDPSVGQHIDRSA